MKYSLSFLAIILCACSTAQLAQTRAIADPLVSAAVSAYASKYGVPPAITSGVTGVVQNQFWGMLAQAQAKQPIAQGSAIPVVGAAVSQAVTDQKAANPSASTTALLTNALGSLGAIKKP